jgi:hypothetical protein
MTAGIMGRVGTRLLGLVGVVAVLVSLVQASASGLAARVERHPYALGLDVGHACEVGVGGACLELRPTDRFVTIDIRDASGMRVDAWIDFNDRYGAVHRTAAVCGTRRLEIPDLAESADLILHTFTAGALGCSATQGPASATTGEIVVTYERGPKRIFPKQVFASPQDCSAQAPSDIAVPGVTDDGRRVSLDLIVLLDGVDEAVARETFAEAAKSYEPLNIALNVLSYRTVSFTGSDFPYLVSQAKALFGGSVPPGAHIVFTLTSRSPLSLYDQAVAGGGADCIGGIRYPNRSFVLTGLITPVPAGPVAIYTYGTARAAAHEIGHVLGAQHQMSNCVEGATDLAADDVTPCTLMNETVELASRHFGTLEAAVVRGHALAYATP